MGLGGVLSRPGGGYVLDPIPLTAWPRTTARGPKIGIAAEWTKDNVPEVFIQTDGAMEDPDPEVHGGSPQSQTFDPIPSV
jgi:hypothetical protein